MVGLSMHASKNLSDLKRRGNHYEVLKSVRTYAYYWFGSPGPSDTAFMSFTTLNIQYHDTGYYCTGSLILIFL
jgi:hypothetical protein